MSYLSDSDFEPYDAYSDDVDNYSDYEHDFIMRKEDQCKGEAKLVPTFENGFNIDGEIKTQEELQKLVTEHKRSTRTIRKTQELTAGFAALFNDRSSADIILSVNGTPYHTHRFILGLWSPVFCRMLEDSERFAPSMTKDEESDCDMIALNESEDDAHVFNEFLKFLYTEQAAINIEDIWHMVSLANKYNILELLKSCSDFLIKFVHTMALDEELMEILKAAQFWEMHHLQSCVWQIILEKMYFSLEKFLPALEMDQLCEALQSSDLVVETEYGLLLKLTPFLKQLEEAEDEESLRKVSSLIRFTEMSGIQLQKVAQLDIAKHVRSNIRQALFHRCFLWESEEGIDESKGPRCYLSPSPPYFDTRNKLLNTSFSENDENWESCQSIILEEERLEQSLLYRGGDKCFVYHTESKKQWVISDTSISKVSVIAKGELTVVQYECSEYHKTINDATEAVATVTGVIHNEKKDIIHEVKTAKVPAKVDLNRSYIGFRETIYLPFKRLISESDQYVSLFVMARI